MNPGPTLASLVPFAVAGGLAVVAVAAWGWAAWRRLPRPQQPFFDAARELGFQVEGDGAWGTCEGVAVRMYFLRRKGGVVACLWVGWGEPGGGAASFRITPLDYQSSFVTSQQFPLQRPNPVWGPQVWALGETAEVAAFPDEERRGRVLALFADHPMTVLGELGVAQWFQTFPPSSGDWVRRVRALVSWARASGLARAAPPAPGLGPLQVSSRAAPEPEPDPLPSLVGMTRKLGLEHRNSLVENRRLVLYRAFRFLEKQGFRLVRGAVPFCFLQEKHRWPGFALRKILMGLECEAEGEGSRLEVSLGVYSLGQDILVKRMDPEPWEELLCRLVTAVKAQDGLDGQAEWEIEIRRG